MYQKASMHIFLYQSMHNAERKSEAHQIFLDEESDERFSQTTGLV
jgi:hypothetical protein